MKNSPSCSKKISRTLQLSRQILGASLVLAVSAQSALAVCSYAIESEWNNGFTANITIKNDTGAPINNWSVNWQYANNRMSSGWNANFSGSNPYSATNLNWNGNIAVGQSVSFGIQGEKNGGAAERPQVNGAACASTAAPASSAASSSAMSRSSTPALASSSARSSATTQATVFIQEAQAGFCRVDGSIDSNHAGFTGNGFANTNNAQGAAVAWAVDAASSGRHTLTIRFANAGSNARAGALIINGGSNGNYSVSLPATASWTDWQTFVIDVDLVQGNNSVQLVSTGAEGLPNIDSISITGASVKAGTCPTTTSSSVAQSSARSSAASSSAGIIAVIPSAGCGKARSLQNGVITMMSGGVQRSYILEAPTNYSNTKPYRLVVGYHWRGGTAQDVFTGQTVQRDAWSHYGMKKLAGDSTIFVAPQGLGNGWANSGGADVTFTDNMLAQIKSQLCIDENRVFANGFSFGGGMSYAIACARSDVFRAVAVYSGGVISGCSGGTKPIAYFGAHGSSDGVLGIAGGRSMRDKFVNNNGCTAINPPEPVIGGKLHTCTSYSCPNRQYPVRWCAFDGGHDASPLDNWTGQKGYTWLADEAWKFFIQF